MLPNKFIVSKKPREYLVQGLSHCGVFSLKAILSAYRKDIKNHPKEYHTNWIGRHLFSFSIGKDYYDKIFKSFGIKAETKSAAFLSDKERLFLLKRLLAEDTPVMIRIGNGYHHSKRYNSIMGKIVNHWITLWGYDDRKQTFYVYDSGMLKKHWDTDIPIGNTTRTYEEVLRDWNFGKWQVWSWYISWQSYLYVKVNIGARMLTKSPDR